MKRKTLFILAGAVLFIGFIATMLLTRSEKPKDEARPPTASRELLVRMHSPTLGKADAPVVIVEFLDPACETCRRFYPFVKEMMAANPDRIRLVLRYAPFHRGSEQVVAMLEAARRQGKFWPALEALLVSQDAWVKNHAAQPDLAWMTFEGLGLDAARMKADMASPDTAAVIAQDLKDAAALDVTKTPEFFVNGRPLEIFGYEQLRALVNAALASAPR